MSNRPPEPPPLEYDDLDVSDAPFPDDAFMGLPEPEAFAYDPALSDDPFALDDPDWLTDDPLMPPLPEGEDPTAPPLPTPDWEGWAWQEARLIGVEGAGDDGDQYEIGCIDVYADVNTGDLGASYLPIAAFADVEVASAFYHDLQRELHETGTPVHAIPSFAADAARRFSAEPPLWRGASSTEYAAYEALRDFSETPDEPDDPPEPALDDLTRTAAELSGADTEPESAPIEERSAFQALTAIGIDAEGFDPQQDPPPFYDAETGTAYWIGVFQPDADDQTNCITSILSLGRNAETGEIEALLAPCAPGDWDKTYGAAEYLIDVAQRSGIAGCFDAAEGMALATEQRDLWETPLGLPLEPDAAQEIADYTRETWEVDL